MERTASFGYWLRRRRKALDLTQEQLAQKVGCAVSTIKKFEGDERRPSKVLAERLANLLELPLEERAAFVKAARAEMAIDQLDIATQPISTTATPAPIALLPTGTVTFLFTDIEDSTRLWSQYADGMNAALSRHDALLHAAIERHGGIVFKTVGDAFHAAFVTAADALAAALAAQRALLSESWSELRQTDSDESNLQHRTSRIAVRMALHSGTAALRAGDYFGRTLNHIARLLAAGHGGQILLSAASSELLREHLPPDVLLRELGAHWLKSLPQPEQIYQLVAADLPSDFPALHTLDRRTTNLPAQTTAFIGRERELAAVRGLLNRADVRLVTLTGPGGTGKTRLGQQLALELLDDFPDGVWFVHLAPISDPGLLAARIAQTLSVHEGGGQPIQELLKNYLRAKRLLLLLDNFEQIAVAAPLVGELLAAACGLKVLITSRAPLHLSGEREFAVPPLPLPDPKQLPQQLEHLTQNDAVRLFIERAQAVKADFAVTDENGPTVADICRRLDGLPLAIELAATRIKLFAPQALLSRLDNRLKFLTGGARDLPERQQTIRHTIDWSYELLGEAEQTLFARLGVFVGGCTLEAAEAVCKGDDNLPIEVVDGAAALMDKSLVRQEEGIDGEPRLLMLETIREYALERLAASGEMESMRRHHSAYYLALAEAAASQLDDPEPRRWLDRLDQEHDNLRAALRWSLTHDATTAGLRLCTALYSFWEDRGHWDEGRMWTEAMLAASGEVAPHLRMEAFSTIAEFAWKQGDYATATARMTESLSLSRALDDRRAMGHCLMILGVIALKQASYERAAALLTESMEMSRSAGEALSGSLLHLGELALAQEEYAQAQRWLQESLAICREGNDTFYIARLLSLLGEVALGQGDAAGARALVQESVAVSRDVGHPGVMASALAAHASAVAAGPAQRPEDIQRAARIWGAAEVLREQVGMFLAGADRTRYERAIEHARVRLRPEVWAAAWAEGRALTLEQAIAEALEHAGLGVEPRQTFAAN